MFPRVGRDDAGNRADGPPVHRDLLSIGPIGCVKAAPGLRGCNAQQRCTTRDWLQCEVLSNCQGWSEAEQNKRNPPERSCQREDTF